MNLHNFLFWRKDTVLERLAHDAAEGDRSAHDSLISGVKNGRYRLKNVSSTIFIDGNVSGSLLVAGGNNTIVQLTSDKYEWFDDVVSAAATLAVKFEVVDRLSKSILTSGSGALFADNQIGASLEISVAYVAYQATEGNSQAGALIYSTAMSPKIEPIVEYLLSELVLKNLDQKTAEAFANLCWQLGEGELFSKAVELGLEHYPDSVDLKYCKISIFERTGQKKKAIESLVGLLVERSLVEEHEAGFQGAVRTYLWHLDSGSTNRHVWLDEAIAIYEAYSSENNDLAEKQIDLLRMSGREVGFLEHIEKHSKRNSLFQAAKKAISENEFASARQLLGKCLSLDRAVSKYKNIFEDVLELAVVCEEMKDYSRAKNYLTEILLLNERMGCGPGQVGALVRMAEVSKEIAFSEIKSSGKISTSHFENYVGRAIELSKQMGDPKTADMLTSYRSDSLKHWKTLNTILKYI